MVILGKQIYGSGNSVDVDILYVVDKLPETIKECKDFCDEYKKENENLNIGVITNGVLSECFKGTIDELNNSIYHTYNLHSQDDRLMVERTVERDVFLKIIRAIRSILSHFSRSQLRPTIKKALKGSWEDRLSALRDIANEDSFDFDSLNNNMTKYDILKLVAFQIGQTKALIAGKELYTKDDVANRYPTLKSYLERTDGSWFTIKKELSYFVDLLSHFRVCPKSVVESETNVGFMTDASHYIVYDLITEKKIYEN